MSTECMPALQGYRFYKHLEANGTAELFPKHSFLHFPDICRIITKTVLRTIFSLTHAAIGDTVDGGVGIAAQAVIVIFCLRVIRAFLFA